MLSRRSSGVLLRLAAVLMLGSAIALVPPGTAVAQSSTPAILNIPAQPLAQALIVFSQQTRIEVFVPSAVAAGKRSTAVRGSLSPQAALQQLLSGTGLTYAYNGTTFSISDPNVGGNNATATVDGAVALDTIDVSGGGQGYNADSTYEQPASIAYISSEDIQRFRGTSTGDFLKGQPGVMTGDNRNSGAIDINVRGMQGEGRVATVIDGSVQQSTVYRGYSGVASRVYLDPDLIGDVVIEKGPSAAPDAVGATGGVARISTLQAKDILRPGEDQGFRVRASTIGNTASVPPEGTLGTGNGTAERFDRPSLFDTINSGSGSLAYAQRFGDLEVVAGYARRRIGNYFAGTNGSGPDEGGLNHFGRGEEVLNTSQNNTSYLLRGVYKWGDGHKLDAAYVRYESDFGEMMPSQIIRFGGAEQAPLSRVEVDTKTLRYSWNPADNDLINLKADVWRTGNYTRIETPYRFDIGGIALGYNEPYLSQSNRWGVNVSNTSSFSGSWGALDFSYGASYSNERLKPVPDEESILASRDGEKEEKSAFAAAEYRPYDWLTLNGALRYTDAQSEDFAEFRDCHTTPCIVGTNKEQSSGFAPIASVIVEPLQGLQLYARYAEAIRTPSTFESTRGWSANPLLSSSLSPEHSYSREVGVNFQREDVFTGADKLQLKVAYFDNKVEDYITRYDVSYYFANIPLVRFKGVEFSAKYDSGKIFGGISLTKYIETEFCAMDGFPEVLTCRENGSPAGYGQMHLPPEFSGSLILGARFFEERLELGSRITYVGERPPTRFSGAFTATIDWEAYTLVDLFGSYKLSDDWALDFAVDNLTDQYYMDALNLGLMPSPGRTLRLGFSGKF